MFVESSGSIRAQIGQSLNAIRIKTDEGDVIGVADHLRLLVALCSPKLTPEQRQKFKLPSVPGGRDRHGAKERELFDKCMNILGELLEVVSQNGLYSYQSPPVGDASDLAIIGDETDDETDAVSQS